MSSTGNIFGTNEGSLSEEQLSAYLQGSLTDAERWEVEQWLTTEGVESDALEGLGSISNEEAQRSKSRINARLQQSIGRKKKRRGYLNNQRELMTAVLIVLLLVVICFGLMWWMKHGAHH